MDKKFFVVVLSGLLVIFLSIGALLARTTSKDNAYSYLTIFSNIIHLVDSNYVESVDFNKVMDSALHGMVENLDPDSFYLRGKDVESYKKALEENKRKAGVGLTITKRFGMVLVVAVEHGSSADEKSIKAGDFIRSIDDQYVQSVPVFKIDGLLKGADGTTVKVSVFRSALEKPEEFVLTRHALVAPYVDSYVAQPNIGYLRVRHLVAGVENEIAKKLENFRQRGITSMVLDLRGCTEDNQDAAVAVAGLFVGPNQIVQLSKRDGVEQTITGQGKALFKGNLLVLIDYTTAGGSEIVAGAIQDSGTGKAFGLRTFGRGGIQKLIPAGENFVVLTTEKYLTPKGRVILNNGIEPSIPYKEDLKVTEKPEEEQDQMLNKAIEYLRYPSQKAA